MKKIGLCVSCKGTNYGTLLQAYATQQAVASLGYDTEIIDYYPGKDPHPRYNPAHFLLKGQYLLFDLGKKKPVLDEAQKENESQRKLGADEFRKQFLHSFVRCDGYQALHANSKNYDAVLVGSDQVWNPKNANSNFYTLRFAADGVRRVAYAASIGVDNYPRYLRGELRDFISKIDYLSVREQNASRIIAECTGRTAEVVCDPTALLTKEEWAQRIPPRSVDSSEYILCYFLGDCVLGRQTAKWLSKRTGFPVKTILSNEVPLDSQSFGQVISGAAVSDFINLIRGAALVLTDSFHGIMLSLIHEKQFYCFYRHRENTPYQRNIRIDDILCRMNLRTRLLVTPECDLSEIDYATVTPTLNQFRERSWSFLKQALPS